MKEGNPNSRRYLPLEEIPISDLYSRLSTSTMRFFEPDGCNTSKEKSLDESSNLVRHIRLVTSGTATRRSTAGIRERTNFLTSLCQVCFSSSATLPPTMSSLRKRRTDGSSASTSALCANCQAPVSAPALHFVSSEHAQETMSMAQEELDLESLRALVMDALFAYPGFDDMVRAKGLAYREKATRRKGAEPKGRVNVEDAKRSSQGNAKLAMNAGPESPLDVLSEPKERGDAGEVSRPLQNNNKLATKAVPELLLGGDPVLAVLPQHDTKSTKSEINANIDVEAALHPLRAKVTRAIKAEAASLPLREDITRRTEPAPETNVDKESYFLVGPQAKICLQALNGTYEGPMLSEEEVVKIIIQARTEILVRAQPDMSWKMRQIGLETMRKICKSIVLSGTSVPLRMAVKDEQLRLFVARMQSFVRSMSGWERDQYVQNGGLENLKSLRKLYADKMVGNELVGFDRMLKDFAD